MSDDVKTLNETLVNVRLDLARLEGKVDVIRDLQHKVEDVATTATDADDRSKSAHHRLDKLEKDIEKKLATIDKIIFWFATTIIGALVLGGINLLYKR